MGMLVLLGLLALWIALGYLVFVATGRNPRAGASALLRSVNRRICLEGDSIEVTLACSDTGFPLVEAKNSTPWDIVLLIDHSGSMGSGDGSALEEAKQAAKNLIYTTPRDFRYCLVEFDHRAEELCPFAHRGRGLTRALKGIAEGGGTDIALGLRVVNYCLNKLPLSVDRKRAVVLLSDGGSAADPAIAEAEKLKKDAPDLLLITIGLGAADMPLLRKLASTPDDCYQAGDIEELTELYQKIGRVIVGNKASKVQVKDHFQTGGRWRLRGWGELHPASRRKADQKKNLFEFTWLLATLEKTPTELTYFLEAQCPGWHSIAPERAVLNAELASGQPYVTQSNRGPRVLVLPSIRGWQLIWFLLNPLFFLLFGRWFCRGIAQTRKVEPTRPELTPLQPPSALTPMPPAIGPLPLRPSLILGLGFGGVHSLVHCKRLLWERGDKRVDFRKLKFLGIDTASEEFFPNPSAGVVTLSTQERLNLNSQLEPLLSRIAQSHKQEYAWLPARQLVGGAARPDLQRGTGHQRSIGRLAILENRAKIESRLRSMVQELLSQGNGNEIDILLVGTAGGGTSSGGMPQLCWLLRHLSEELQVAASIQPFLISPMVEAKGGFADKRETQLRFMNSRALLRELDRLAALRGELLTPMPGDVPARRWFDRLFCIGPATVNEAGDWSALEMLYPAGAEALFSWLASDGFRNHFQLLNIDETRTSAQLGRCVVSRIVHRSVSLYPETLGRYVTAESLRRCLAQRFWRLQPSSEIRYTFRSCKPTEAAKIRDAWMQGKGRKGDPPWVFRNIEILADAQKLQRELLSGTGPTIIDEVSSWERGEYLRQQREMARTFFDIWITEALNGQLEEVSGSHHGLGPVIHALQAISDTLEEGVIQARYLEDSEHVNVFGDAGLVAELASQAGSEVKTCITHLLQWDAALGEGSGSDRAGLLRYLDMHVGVLAAEIQALTGGAQPGKGTYVRLPITWARIENLIETCTIEIDRILQNLQWRIRRDGPNFLVTLLFQGIGDPLQCSLEGMKEGSITTELMEALVLAGKDRLPRDQWHVEEMAEETALTALSPLMSPRTSGLNPQARGIYLVQRGLKDSRMHPFFKLTPHVAVVELEPIDHQEARVALCETQLSSEFIWPYEAEEALPFVFNEEFYAYEAYVAYCRTKRLRTQPLAPRVVALCSDLDALLSFAIVGLAANGLKLEMLGGRNWWTCVFGSGSFQLCESEEEPSPEFMAVANAWRGRNEPGFRSWQLAPTEGIEEVVKRMSEHSLLRDLNTPGLADQFCGVIHGLLLMRDYGDH